MLITKIEKQKKIQKRYSIYIDGEFKFGVNEEDLLYLKLKQDTDITEERYNYIMEYVIYTKAKDKAYMYLSYKSRTEKELRDKLIEQEYPEEIIDRIIELFKRHRFIDDGNYTINHINNRIKFKPMGKKMMKYELMKKGIADDIIESTLNSSEICEIDMAVALLQKKIKGETQIDKKESQRAYNYLLRRGFNFDIINRAFKIVINDNEI